MNITVYLGANEGNATHLKKEVKELGAEILLFMAAQSRDLWEYLLTVCFWQAEELPG